MSHFRENWVTDRQTNGLKDVLTDNDFYMQMSRAHNPYGDGNAGGIICDILVNRGVVWLYL